MSASGSGSSNKASSFTRPEAPGTGVGGGLLNFIFGAPQRVSQGQFVAGAPQTFDGKLASELTNEEIGDLMNRGSTTEKDLRLIRQFRDRAGSPLDASTQAQFSKFGNILDLAEGQNPFAQDFLRSTSGLADTATSLFGESASALSDLITGGGQPVDTSALAAAGLTDLREQFSTTGGLFSSDIQAAQGRNALELQVGAEEAARQRQLEALGLGQTLGATQQQFASGLLNLGSQFEQVATPGGRQLGLFQSLFGQQGTDPFSIGSSGEAKSKGKAITGSISGGSSGGGGGG